MNIESLKKDDMFDVNKFIPEDPKTVIDPDVLAMIEESQNPIMKLQGMLDGEEWERLDKAVSVSYGCIYGDWNKESMMAGSTLKRDTETPLVCPHCDKGALTIISRFPRIIEGGMRSDCRYVENRFILIECPSCKHIYAAFLGGEPPIYRPPHAFRKDLVG
ncbi:MAG: hypothetical protein Q7S53_02950 [bacterium]|nr:hypothetical protein [bacterium]